MAIFATNFALLCRAWLPIDAVRAIAVSPSELRVKRKQHWKQASAEMKEYIRQCECVS